MRIRWKILIAMMAFVIFAAYPFAMAHYLRALKNSDTQLINLAGRQRLLSQIVSKDFLRWQNTAKRTEQQILKESLETNMRLFERTQEALLYGGNAPLTYDINGEHALISATFGDIFTRFNDADILAKTFFAAMRRSLETEIKPSAADVEDERLLAVLSAGVGLLQEEYEDSFAHFFYIQAISLFLSLVVVLLCLRTVSKALFAPLKKVRQEISKHTAHATHETSVKRIITGLQKYHRILILFSFALLLSLFASFYAGFASYAQQADARQVNISGRQRMLTEKIIKEYWLLIHAEAYERDKLVAQLSRSIDLLEKTQQVLLNGGQAPRLFSLAVRSGELSKATGKVVPMLQKARAQIDPFVTPLRQSMLGEPTPSAIHTELAQNLLQQFTAITEAFEQQSIVKMNKVIGLQWISLSVAMLCLGGALWILNASLASLLRAVILIYPHNETGKAAQQFLEGIS